MFSVLNTSEKFEIVRNTGHLYLCLRKTQKKTRMFIVIPPSFSASSVFKIVPTRRKAGDFKFERLVFTSDGVVVGIVDGVVRELTT